MSILPILGLVSVVIPARNEPYLKNTIDDLLSKARGSIEIIVILDGYWPSLEDISKDPRVVYIHRGEARGMRNGINTAVSVAKGEFILKSDAHCMFGEGFDEILKSDLEANWIAVPRRYPLDPTNWQIEVRRDIKYPVDYMYLSKDLHGEPWPERRDANIDKEIDDLMSAQGSCWFMKKSYYYQLELLDEDTYGIFWNEFQEIGLKCWLSGGRVIVNKNTWYAHWHKPSDVGRGYNMPKEEQVKAHEAVQKWLNDKGWHKQTYSVKWLVDKFAPVPTWE